MNSKLRKTVTCFSVWAGMLVVNVAQAQNPPPFVQVKAYMQCYGGNFVYHYKVVNNYAKASISGFAVGRKPYNFTGQEEPPELMVAPIFMNKTYKLTSPAGWTGGAGYLEEFPERLSVDWEIANATIDYIDEASFIRPGQTLTGFSVTLGRQDSTYLNSHFTVDLSYGSSFTGLIEFDPSEPSLCP